MPLSRIDLCSRALLKIGASVISSLEDGTAEADVAANLYDYVRDALLSAHPWNFATTRKKLAVLSRNDDSEFANSFALPADCLRVLSAGSGESGAGLVYRLYGGCLHANASDVVLTYVFRANEADDPPFFSKVLITYLAAEFCIPLTDSTSRWESLHKLADAELRNAKLIDAQEETPQSIQDYCLVESRY